MPRKIKPVFQVFHPLVFNCAELGNPMQIADFMNIVPKINEAEFGFGKGGFIMKRAAENPDKIFVAVEAVPSLCLRAYEKACSKKLANLYLVLGDARLFFSHYLRDTKLDTINFLFPDPWHKSRYHKHRMVTDKTVPYLAKILKNTGRVVVRSDNHIVAFDIMTNLLNCGFVLGKMHWNEDNSIAYTEWESKAIVNGRKILHCEFEIPENFVQPELSPIFDIRQVNFRNYSDGKIKILGNIDNADSSSRNALPIPEFLLH